VAKTVSFVLASGNGYGRLAVEVGQGAAREDKKLLLLE